MTAGSFFRIFRFAWLRFFRLPGSGPAHYGSGAEILLLFLGVLLFAD